MPVLVTVDPMSGTVFEGLLARINPQANLRTRSFPAEVLIDNPDRTLKPGMFARMKIVTGEKEGATLAPLDAVVPTGREKLIFVVKDGMAKAVPVTTGAQTRVEADKAPPVEQDKEQTRIETHVEILEGDVKPGDMDVVRGNDLLQDNAPVVVLNGKGANRADR
jgi:membrane fusion protein (multidrug efflux system)